MNALPKWLDQWLMFHDSPMELFIHEIERNPNYRAVKVEGIWTNDSSEVSQIQLDMIISSTNTICVWKPHLCPEENMVIGDLFFQSPAIVLKNNEKLLALVPNLDFIEQHRIAPHYMDYVKPEKKLFYGLGHYVKTRHVYHQRVHKPFSVKQGQVLFQFYLVEWTNILETRNLIPVVEFLWETFAKKRMMKANLEKITFKESLNQLETYAQYTYDWAFHHWEPIVWQEFTLNGENVGGCVFIVRAAQSPGHGKENSWREKKSLWNQAWFSSLRSAYGYRIWGEQWNNPDMVRRAELAKNFALSAPQKQGLFPSVFWADDNDEWEHGAWGHSDRRPDNHNNFGHLLDMSWTCFWMLKWYNDIEQDPKLIEYSINFADRLLMLQAKKGNFPAWVHMETGKVSPFLLESPETSMHALFLAKLYMETGEKKYLQASQKAMQFVIDEVIPVGRWEDFETYWSCSRMWEGKQYGKKERRSGLYHQCNFSIYWTTEALKELYNVTKDEAYLNIGEQVLAELSLYQAIWEPSYIGVPVLGGFGVMNTDDEWNDARQSLIALTYYDYFKLTGKKEYQYRSFWAMKASFYMMYCPENPEVRKLYEKTHPHFTEKDYGFEMENGHHSENIDIAGEFTIFDWGNGSASASLAELLFIK